MKYYCEDCKGYFEEPKVVIEMHGFGYGNGAEISLCAHCNSDYIEEAEDCECGKPMPSSLNVCDDCSVQFASLMDNVRQEFGGDFKTALNDYRGD
jgi:hypothetical protein